MKEQQNPISLSLEDLTNSDKVRAFGVLAYIDKHGLDEAKRDPKIRPELDYCLEQGAISQEAIERAEGVYQKIQESRLRLMLGTLDARGHKYSDRN